MSIKVQGIEHQMLLDTGATSTLTNTAKKQIQSKSNVVGTSFIAASVFDNWNDANKTVLETNEHQKFVPIYVNKSPEETIFHQTLSELETQYPERFQLQYVYSQAQIDKSLFGRIDTGNTNYAIKNLGKTPAVLYYWPIYFALLLYIYFIYLTTETNWLLCLCLMGAVTTPAFSNQFRLQAYCSIYHYS